MKSHSLQKQCFLLSLLFFLIFVPTGNLPSDTEYSAVTALSISKGMLSIPFTPDLPHLKSGRNGRYYSKYGIGYALLFIPAAIATRLLTPAFPLYEKQLLYLFCCLNNTMIASFIILLFMNIFLKLGYSRNVTFFVILSIMTGSILLPYSKINHSEIPTVALVLLFLLKFHSAEELTFKNGVFFGSIGSALLLLKIGNVLYSGCIFLCAFYLIAKRKSTLRGTLSLFLIPLITLLFMLVLNIWRFGSPLNTGYGSEQYLFTTPLINGLLGLLFSPSRSAFLYSPLVILSIISIPSAWKRSPKIALAVIAMSLGNLLFYAKWHDWHGGWSWGPRLIVPSIILLHLFFPEFILNLKSCRWKRICFAFVLPAAVAINLLGSMVWYQQTHYFFRHDYLSVCDSQPVIAAKLLGNKLKGNPEVYNCEDFNQDCKGNNLLYDECVKGNTMDFTHIETFQGFATFWSCLSRYLNLPFMLLIPFLLLSSVSAIGYHVWRHTLRAD